MEKLEENGIPQTAETLDEEELKIMETGTDADASEEEQEVNGKPTVLTPIDDSDVPTGEESGHSRWNGPFTARMKVTRNCVVVTLKRNDTEETQSFYIPVRW